MDAKRAPYGPQVGLKTDLEAIQEVSMLEDLKGQSKQFGRCGRVGKIRLSWAHGRRVGRRVNPPLTQYNCIQYIVIDCT